MSDTRDEEFEIQFKPVTRGLGFHPFSDGLPYAPVSKTGLAGGTGAVSGGPPRISTPRLPASPKPSQRPQSNLKAGLPVLPNLERPATGAIAAGRPIPAIMNRPLGTPAQARNVAPADDGMTVMNVQEKFGFVYLFKRIFAYLIDTLLNLSLCIGAFLIALWKLDINPMQATSPSILLGSALFLALFNWALVTAQEIAFGATVGKRLFGLSLQGGGAATIFIRGFFFLISVGFGGLGLVWAVFDRRRRCWHDLIVDLQPQEIARL